MQHIYSQQAQKELNKLYKNRSYYLTNQTFCPSFIEYIREVDIDFEEIDKDCKKTPDDYSARYANLSKIDITYQLLDANSIAIHRLELKQLDYLLAMCNYDRKIANQKIGKRPPHIKPSPLLSNYRLTKFKGGEINGEQVQVVKRLDASSRSGKDLFNYLYKGRLLSRYDLLSLTPFTIQADGELKAYGDAANGKRYWIYPNGKWRLLRESKSKKKLFIENNNATNKIRNMKNKKVVRLTESQLHNIIAESVSQILNEIGDTPKGAYDLGRLYGRYKGRKLYSPSKENMDRISDMEKYIEAKKFDDVARRRAFDRGDANQRFMTDFAFDIEDKKRGYDRMVAKSEAS